MASPFELCNDLGYQKIRTTSTFVRLEVKSAHSSTRNPAYQSDLVKSWSWILASAPLNTTVEAWRSCACKPQIPHRHNSNTSNDSVRMHCLSLKRKINAAHYEPLCMVLRSFSQSYSTDWTVQTARPYLVSGISPANDRNDPIMLETLSESPSTFSYCQQPLSL